MKKSNQLNSSESGFTLLEVIITIVIAAILGTLLVTFMGTSITKSAVPLNQTRELGISIGNIETITAEYASYLKIGVKTSADWTNFQGFCSSHADEVINTTISNNGKTVNMLQVKASTGDQNITAYFTQ